MWYIIDGIPTRWPRERAISQYYCVMIWDQICQCVSGFGITKISKCLLWYIHLTLDVQYIWSVVHKAFSPNFHLRIFYICPWNSKGGPSGVGLVEGKLLWSQTLRSQTQQNVAIKFKATHWKSMIWTFSMEITISWRTDKFGIALKSENEATYMTRSGRSSWPLLS